MRMMIGDNARGATGSVYRLYGDHDRLLYVGSSFQPQARITAHTKEGALFAHLVTRWVIDPPQDLYAAWIEEEQQIAELAPAYNVIGNVRCGYPSTLRLKSQLPASPIMSLSRGGNAHAR